MVSARYYAIHNPQGVIQIRRTVKEIRKMHASLTRPAGFELHQVYYTGGKLLGTMRYDTWVRQTAKGIATDGYLKIDKTLATGLAPFLMRGDG